MTSARSLPRFRAAGLVRAVQHVALAVFAGWVVLISVAHFGSNLNLVVDLYADRFADRDTVNGPTEDYVAFYAAGTLVREGHGDKIYDIEVVGDKEQELKGRAVGGTGRLGFFNPPFVAAIWAPLSLLPLDAALAVWGVLILGVGVTAAIGGPWLIGLRRWRWGVATAAMLTSNAAMVMVAQAQVSALVIASWLLFAGFTLAEKPRAAGAALALGLVKPHLMVLPVLYLAWHRQWRALAAFGCCAVALVTASLAVSGPSALVSYPRFLIDSMSWRGINGVSPQAMINWLGYFERTVGDDRAAIPNAVATAATIGAALFVMRRGSREHFLAVCAVMLSAGMMASGHQYMQDLVLAVVVCWFGLASGHRDLRWIVSMGVLLLALQQSGNGPTYGLLVVLAVALYSAERPGRPPSNVAPSPVPRSIRAATRAEEALTA